jgi:hypothetical protein
MINKRDEGKGERGMARLTYIAGRHVIWRFRGNELVIGSVTLATI